MTALILISSLLLIIFAGWLLFQLFLFLKRARESSLGYKAKDVYIVKYGDERKKNNEELASEVKRNQQAMNYLEHLKPNDSTTDEGENEKREYTRIRYEYFVEFIKEGVLYKEASKDISYSGMFIKSKTPEHYSVNDLILITFQYPKGNPQRRNGRIVRNTREGIGVKFLNH